MSKQQKRIFFLCAQHSVRELMAASLLAAQAADEWDIWITPTIFSAEDIALARQVLDEVHIPLLPFLQSAEPSFAQTWDEGIVLCSGATDQ